MTSEIASTRALVVLTPHPLQRVGAFALAALAEVSHPEEVTEEDLAKVAQLMEGDLRRTTRLANSKEPDGFWLSASYLFWPNSALNITSRGNLTVAERRERLKDWRTLHEPGRSIGVPCALCARPASGYYGKVDVPLAAGINYRNATARGHDGMALCRACLLSFYALPYGCAISGGRATVVHSWDNEFLKKVVFPQVGRMQREADIAAGRFGASRPYARQVAALYEIRNYEERFTAGVELIVFSNSNKEQTYDGHQMDQPLAEWLRQIRHDPRFRDGWRYLRRAHHSDKVPGLSVLARNLFDRPQQIPSTATAYLTRLADELSVPAAETPALAVLIYDYASRVLNVNNSDAEQIRMLAKNIAAVAGQDKTEFKKFAVAARRTRDLQRWLRRQAVDQVLYTKQPDGFVTEHQWLLLFDSGVDSYLHQDLLLVSTLEQVHKLNPEWRVDDPQARKEADDEPDTDEEEYTG